MGDRILQGEDGMKTITAAAAFAILAMGGAAVAQSIDGNLVTAAGKVGAAKNLSEFRTETAVTGNQVAVTGQWTPVTLAYMNSTVAPNERVRTLSLSARVDWNGDGVPDVAYMANGQDEMAVIVQLGGNKGRVFAMRWPGQWGGRQEIVAAGKRRIIVNMPEADRFTLSAESGKPLSYHSKQGG